MRQQVWRVHGPQPDAIRPSLGVVPVVATLAQRGKVLRSHILGRIVQDVRHRQHDAAARDRVRRSWTR
jgi:hypothetical protein